MTPQEHDMIQGLIDRVQQTRLPEKDTDAEQLLQQSLGRNPDALYVLAQTVLVQKYALDQAQKQLTDLKSQLEQARQQQQPPHKSTSFLGSLLGHNDPAPPPPPRPSSTPQYTPVPGYQPQPGYAPVQPGVQSGGGQFGSPSYGAPMSGAPQGGGFLRSAMQTAAGVAAGALAFQGIESLMHGFGGGGGGFGGGERGFGGFDGGAPREEIVNNYYGDSAGGQDGGNLSPDVEDRRGDNADGGGDRFADTGSDYAANNDNDSSVLDGGGSDASSSFDSDDSSSFDSGDSSSFDSGDSGSFDSGTDDSSFS